MKSTRVVVVALLSYFLIEKPVLRLRSREAQAIEPKYRDRSKHPSTITGIFYVVMHKILLLATLPAMLACAQDCDLSAYRAQDGLKAQMHAGALELTWQGERGDQLRASFTIRAGQPMVKELAAHKNGGNWIVLGTNLTPEFEVTSGVRRLSEQQMAPLRDLKIALTPEVVEREKWNAFWDSPLVVPGRSGTNLGLPRKPEEIHRDWARFNATGCRVKTDGARIEVVFPGWNAGVFSGSLQYTVYRGTNLLRQEAIAKTNAPSVAYKYITGLKGFTIADDTKVVWRDTARGWQQYAFGGAVNRDPVGLVARNRLGILEASGGSLAFLPPSHKFFWSREIETNLGYVYYRKDSATSFSIGARQPDREIGAKPWGISDEIWTRRVAEARGDLNNFALYNAPPGTLQRMADLLTYLSPNDLAAPPNNRSWHSLTMMSTRPSPVHKVLVQPLSFPLQRTIDRRWLHGPDALLALRLPGPWHQYGHPCRFSLRLACHRYWQTPPR